MPLVRRAERLAPAEDDPVDPVAVVGGGPGGALLSYLLARAGVPVTLLESRPDFEREYRGDSLHPWTMELLDELGLVDDVLALPHVKASAFRFHTPSGTVSPADYSRLPTRFNYVAILPQARLIELLVAKASAYEGFRLVRSAKVNGLTERGLTYRGPDGPVELTTSLVVGTDGRYSAVRRLADLPVESLGATTDLIWFRLPRRDGDPVDADVDLYCGPGQYVGVLGGSDHWRVGLSIPKGGYPAAREAGVEPIRDFIRTHVPWLADRAGELTDVADTTLLSVDISRAERWHGPGVLLIGDAAHVISPTGGNGILMAVQDAVVAANRLVGPLREGTLTEADLAAVQAEREPAIRKVQDDQVRTERSAARARERGAVLAPPRWLTPLFRVPAVQRRSARANGYGPTPPSLDLDLLDGGRRAVTSG